MVVKSKGNRLAVADHFVSAKTRGDTLPIRHPLIRTALTQATLDPAVRSIEYIATVPGLPPAWNAEAIAIERDGIRYHLDIVEARPRRSIAERLLAAQSLLDLGLRPLVRTESDVLREPRCTNCRTVFEYSGRPVKLELRMQILGVLAEESTLPLGELLGRLRSNRDPATAVMSLACEGIIELDLTSRPLGPLTSTRLRS